MHFALSEEQLILRDSARAALRGECSPTKLREAFLDNRDRIPSAWAKLAEIGVLGMTAPVESGGLAMSEVDTVLLFEEAGRVGLPDPIVDHVAIGIPLLSAAPPPFRNEWLPRAIRGDAVVATRVGPDRRLAHAEGASLFLLEHGDDLHAVLPKDVTLNYDPGVDGAHRAYRIDWKPTNHTVLLSSCRSALDAAFERGVVATSAELLGLAQQLLELSVEYAKLRTQFGRPIGSFQAIKHHLANVLLRLEFARPVVYRAAYALAHDSGNRHLAGSMAKIYATEAAQLAARVALQVHGAIGYSYEHDLHLYMKRVWVLATRLGTLDFHLERAAKNILLKSENSHA